LRFPVNVEGLNQDVARDIGIESQLGLADPDHTGRLVLHERDLCARSKSINCKCMVTISYSRSETHDRRLLPRPKLGGRPNAGWKAGHGRKAAPEQAPHERDGGRRLRELVLAGRTTDQVAQRSERAAVCTQRVRALELESAYRARQIV